MSDLRAVAHEFLPGLKVTCRMEGDTFEMEDQRNWTDASYKTYVRPLALPWPYVITKGETIDQKVTLKVSGTVSKIKAVESRLVLTVGEQTAGRAMPPLGLGLDPKDIDATEQSLSALGHVAPPHLVCYCDPRLGHGEADLKRMAAIGKALGAELWLEFVIPSVDHFEQDLEELGRAVTRLGNPFAAVMVSPASDLKCTLPGSPWPPRRWNVQFLHRTESKATAGFLARFRDVYDRGDFSRGRRSISDRRSGIVAVPGKERSGVSRR
jgi:hypothetical protein